MAALSLPQLGLGGSGLGAEGLRGSGAAQRVAFDDALARSGAKDGVATPKEVGPVDPIAAAQRVEPVRATGAAGLENDAASRALVRRSLELGSTSSNQGDAILGGLQRLRGTFDAQHRRIQGIMGNQAVDTNALLSMQMEVAQYSLLVDVSSKLTGKTTQSLDTLMKGQ